MSWRLLAWWLILASLGCQRSEPAPPPAATPAGNAPAQFSLKKTIVRQGVPGDLHELGQLYVTYNTNFGKSPASLEEFQLEKDASKLFAAVKNGVYVVNYKVNSLSSNVALAYEKEGDTEGKHYVVMGDGSVKKVTEDELKAALVNP